jgi:hypothetical protein
MRPSRLVRSAIVLETLDVLAPPSNADPAEILPAVVSPGGQEIVVVRAAAGQTAGDACDLPDRRGTLVGPGHASRPLSSRILPYVASVLGPSRPTPSIAAPQNETAMIAEMAIGTCRLCLEEQDLQSSHFMPAAMYKIALESDGHPPIILTKNKKLQTSKQAQTPLLCSACEGLFNKRGEDWVLSRCWQSDGSFPLRDVLKKMAPAYSKPGFKIFDTAGVPGIDHDKLVYCAASIFWRASVHDWHLVETNPALKLGPYAEELRLYLLNKGGFPANAALALSVSWEDDVRAAALCKFPYLKKHLNGSGQFNFLMNGLTFDLFVGTGLSVPQRGMCLLRAPNRPLFVADAAQAQIIKEFGTMDSTAKPYGKLKE